MTESIETAALLGERICPWLIEPMRRLLDVAGKESLSHAWLITGSRGVGKLNFALFLARQLLDEHTNPERWQSLSPRDASAAMRARYTPHDHHPDLHLVFPDEGKQTISVDRIRSMADAIALKGFGGRAKLVVVEPAEAMTTAAANALLKTLEEPPPETFLLLVTDTPGRLPATIRSRCQKLVIQQPSLDSVTGWFSQSGLTNDELSDLGDQTGWGPVELVDALDLDMSATIAEYRNCIEGMYSSRLDPLVVATDWSKGDLDHILGWLVRMLQLEIRLRVMPAGWTPVTVSAPRGLHNICPELTLVTLFSQLEKAQALHDQIGTGINIELGLQVLLLGFRPH